MIQKTAELHQIKECGFLLNELTGALYNISVSISYYLLIITNIHSVRTVSKISTEDTCESQLMSQRKKMSQVKENGHKMSIKSDNIAGNVMKRRFMHSKGMQVLYVRRQGLLSGVQRCYAIR